MRKLGKQFLVYVLVLTLLLSMYTPVFGAEALPETEVTEKQVTEETQIAGENQTVQENQTEADGDEQSDQEAERNMPGEKPSSVNESEAKPDNDVMLQQNSEREQIGDLICNYIFTQEDDIHQSVIIELGEESSTNLESVILFYQDKEGDIKTAQAEEIVENIAAFLLELPVEGQERAFLSVKAVVGGQEYDVSLGQKEDMAQVEVSSEEAAQVVEESNNEEAGLDAQTAEQVENGVVAADENGISADDIKGAIINNNALAESSSDDISTFSLRDSTDVPSAVAVDPQKKEEYIVVLDPGHGTIDTDGYDPGADHTFSDGTKFVEADLTMKIANYVKKELEKYPEITVYMTHDTVGAAKAVKMTLKERVDFAANKHADLLVSLHLNAFDYETAHGAEVLVPKTGRYNSAVAENAQKAANNILKRLTSLGLYDRGLKERDSENGGKYSDGSTADYYAVIREGMKASIPSIIVEHAFLTGAQDKQYLNNEASIKNLAKADAYGIAQYFNIETGGETYEPVPEPKGEWRQSGGNTYYYIGNVKQTGWQRIDNIWYYFNGSGVMLKGWQSIGGYWYYLNSSGHMLTGWQYINGSYYYLNASGSMQTGWQTIEGNRYYLQGSGAMLGQGWHNLGGTWYYMKSNGAVAEGWMNQGGTWYYLTPGTGAMRTGWYKVGNTWYYSVGSGAMQTGWLNQGGTWYYLTGSGAMAEGWVYIGGTWYYLTPGNGVMKTGWYKVKNTWYYSNGNGAMQTGWLHQGATWYYLTGSGAMAEGWVALGGTWYYLTPGDGAMKTGWYKVGSVWYFSSGSGAMQTGWLHQGATWYYLTGSGAMAEGWAYIEGAWYYMTPGNGAMCTGWYKANGRWYYSSGSGAMQTGWLHQGSTWYYLTGSGAMAEGWIAVGGVWYYMNPINGAMCTGWYKIGDTWYYSNGSGAMQTGWLQLGSSWYYLNGSGAMMTGWITVNGKEYYMNGSGVWIPGAKKEETTKPVIDNKNLYAIAGNSSVTADQMTKYFNSAKVKYPSAELAKGGASNIETFSKIVLEEANAEGIRAEVVFTQAMKETGWLKFGGDVSIEQFNFCGLGATGNGVKGNSFKDVRTGIRAQVQHLKAYASTENLNNTCVDLRFDNVTRNSAPYVEWLGIPDNPTKAGWAATAGYGTDLVDMIKKLKSI